MNEIPANLLRKIDKKSDSECWPWLGWKQPSGHGQAWFRGRIMPAHRAVYMAANNLFLDTKTEVCHDCPGGDNPSCCNPSHMFVGTQGDNMRDAFNKKRHVSFTHPESFVRGSACHLAKLNESQVDEIRRMIAEGMGDTEIFRTGKFPISIGGIWRIRHKKAWKNYDKQTQSA